MHIGCRWMKRRLFPPSGLRIWSRVLAGELGVPICATYGLADVEQAHALVESNATRGKVVLRLH